MTFVQTTWGDLREGERIVDKLDRTWNVGRPEHIGADVRVTIEGPIVADGNGHSVVVVKPATDTVTVIREGRGQAVQDRLEEALRHPSPETIQASVQAAVDEDLERARATDPWAEAVKDDTDRAKAVIEAAMGPTTEILPIIDTALGLRSHLYLLHGVLIHEATTRAALLEHHRRSHLLEAEGNGEAGATPHVHEEET